MIGIRARLRQVVARVLAGAVLASLLAAGAPAQELQKATFSLLADRSAYEPGAPVRIAALVEIDDGWHTNSHEPSLDYLIATSLRLDLPAGWGPASIRYPPGRMQSLAFASNQPLSVYDGNVAIIAAFALPGTTAQGNPVVEASLRYQACSDRTCLPPVTTRASLRLSVGAGGEAVAHPAFGIPAGTGDAAHTPVRWLLPGLLVAALLAIAGLAYWKIARAGPRPAPGHKAADQ